MSEMKIQKSFPTQPKPNTDHDAKMRQASKMYEEYFLNEMVKNMRKTVEHAEDPKMAEKIYSEQLDGQTVEKWADQGGIGLADIIYNQLQDRFYGGGQKAPRPNGPIPTEKGTRIKIDETKQYGIPVAAPKMQNGEVSFLYEWDQQQNAPKDVVSPYSGDVIQMYRSGDDRQVVKMQHDDGLLSTISFIGQTKDLKLGDEIAAGQKLGTLSPYATGLTWQVGRVET